MTFIVAIRPEPGLAATLLAGRVAGMDIVGRPLFEYQACPWQPPAPGNVDALLVGSAAAIRLGGRALAGFVRKPVHAVGEATARAAREAGFRVASVGGGGLQQVLDGLGSRPLRLLRIAGAEHVPLVTPAGISIETRTVYRVVPRMIEEELVDELAGGALVLLHSAAAARHLAAECSRLGIARNRIGLAALGPRVAAAAGEGWAQVRAAAIPTEPALLALARDMCH